MQIDKKKKIEKVKKEDLEQDVEVNEEIEDEDIEEEEKELAKQVQKVTKDTIMADKELSPMTRFAALKVAVRSVVLRKSRPGYNGRYSYIPLKHIQAVFTRLELAYGLTSRYTQRRVVTESGVFYDAVRTAFDIKTGQVVEETTIDITDLVLNKVDPTESATYDYFREVLGISEPKDAWAMIFLNYFDPQKKGAFSTYFQRYTYFQLYDFQEVDFDDIEEAPKDQTPGGKTKQVVKKETEGKIKKVTKTKGTNDGIKKEQPEKTAKETREETTEVTELRTNIKKTYGRQKITNVLGPERKLSTMNLEELQSFEKELKEKYEGETE